MMKITVDGKELKGIIEKVECNMLKKFNVSDLGRIILKAENGKLTASSTTVKNWLFVTMDRLVNVIEEGQVAIDKEDFKVITRMTGDVTIAESDNNIIVKNGKKTITLIKYSLEGYPVLEAETGTNKLQFKESDLLEILTNMTVFCADNENNKIMQCINFNLSNRRIEALDGHRIAIRTIDDMEKLDQNGSILLHMETLKDLKKSLDKKSDALVTISEGNKHIIITGKDFTYYQHITEGQYFNVGNMIDFYGDYSFKADREEMLSHIKYYTDNVISKSDHLPIVLKVENEKVISYAHNVRFETSDELEIKDFYGKETVIGFNPYFLLDALKIADVDNVSIKGVNSKSPIMIEGENAKYSFLVLPVNITDTKMNEYLERVNAE